MALAIDDPELDAQTQPVKKPLPVANAPLPTPGASAGQLPPVAGPSTPPPPAIPNAPAAPTTTDPMAFTAPPAAGMRPTDPTNTPPAYLGGQTSLNSAADPYADYRRLEQESKAKLAGGAQPNAGGGYADFTNLSTGTAPRVFDEVGKASLHAQQVADATAQVPTNAQGAIFSDTQRPGVTMTGPDGKPVVPGGSSQDWITAHVAAAESNGGGANPSATTRPIAPSDRTPASDQPTQPSTLPAPIADPIEQALAAATTNSAGPSSSGGSSALTPVTPDTALTNYRISAGPGTDRFAIAQDKYNAARAASEGGYTADLREANEQAFGAGRGVSGMLRTRRGNIASDRQATLAKTESDFLNDALEGSIGDAYRNIGIDQQQQGFEADQQKTGFSQGMALENLGDSRQQTGFNQNLAIQELSNAQNQQQFDQALQKLIAGSSGDPAKLQLLLAQIFGNQSAQSAESAMRLAEA